MDALRSWSFARVLMVVVLVAWVWLLATQLLGEGPPREVSWSELVHTMQSGTATRVVVRPDRIVVTMAKDEEDRPQRIASDRLPNFDDSALIEQWRGQGLVIEARYGQESWVPLLATVLMPVLLFVLFGWMVGRSLQRNARSALDFGRGRPKIFDRTSAERVTFDDVAGVDEAKAELREVISFLTDPERYRSIGAQLPKGTLLVGPPGTGKTLLARAVAGEANVPFFSISGSEFVEMFVGVGASRVRDLFEKARQQAPCIVFIDELDAIGKARGGITAMSVNEEREQTLNQLLVELDGFDPQLGVVIMAASNRPEILDPALLRAGRFDRRVVVDRPDLRGRTAILTVHAKRIRIAPDVQLELVARRTPGMVGADLAKVVNEAALAAVRRSSQLVAQQDFDEAVDRIQLGLEQKSRAMSDDEKRRVAYHEAGHALVAMGVEHADPVHKVTIIPRSIGALGATLQLPTEDRYLVTREELLDRIAVMLGGRAAEQVACGDVSTGAENDLERATQTARMMITRFGMSDSLGVASTDPGSSRYLGFTIGERQLVSEQTAQLVDAEIRRLLEEQLQRASRILESKRAVLESVVEHLLREETIGREALLELAAAPC